MKLIDLVILLTPVPLLKALYSHTWFFSQDIPTKIWDAVTERHIELLDIEDSLQWFSTIELMTFNRMNTVDPI